MQTKNKLGTYIGFSIRSGNVLYGYEKVISTRKRPYLILLDDETGESSKKKITAYAEKYTVKIYSLPSGALSAYCGGKNVKCLGLTDKNLASAAENELKTNIGGNN